MSVNELSFEQSATLLSTIASNATGLAQPVPVDESEFISVANTAIAAGYDKLLGSITQIVGRTIFSTRPYSSKFRGLEVSNQKWGAITRKLNIADKPFEDEMQFDLVDGVSVDMFKVNKPNILQTNFYGANQFLKETTYFRDQLAEAFTGPAQLGSFVSMVTQNRSDMIEQAKENMARATIANVIGGKVAANLDADGGVIHLLTAYNTELGLSGGNALTAATVKQPANYPAFIKWAFAYIAKISSMMEERSYLYQINVTGKEITRHTPASKQKVYVLAGDKYAIESRVLADTFHDNYLSLADARAINFWQNITSPDTINVTPVFMNTSGAFETGSAQTLSNVFAVLFDEEAAGITTMDEWSATSPFNSKGGYWNVHDHFLVRYWNDFTEKSVVFMLD